MNQYEEKFYDGLLELIKVQTKTLENLKDCVEILKKRVDLLETTKEVTGD